MATPLWAFDSGSTGADGAFNPTSSQEIQLPANGIFNYTTVNIPTGITITYTPNAANTPVTLLAQGDVVIDGVIDVSGQTGGSIDDGLPNNSFVLTPGGPGGYAGGRGGLPPAGIVGQTDGGTGLGLGGGLGASLCSTSMGGGGSFGTQGGNDECSSRRSSTYGSTALLPFIGGSGGGGGKSNILLSASGGGGGGCHPHRWLHYPDR
ncbi:MAG: hypothetical protein O7D86_12035 [Proteobacteria bacterium]|nr:hypothetical protein [Pseudomonadota bacterium]